MIYLIYMSGPPDEDHDPSDLSDQDPDLSVRHVWSISWSISSVCPNYLIYILIYPSDLSDLDHDLSDLSVRTIWYIMIHLIYLSYLPDLDHDLSVPYIWPTS